MMLVYQGRIFLTHEIFYYNQFNVDVAKSLVQASVLPGPLDNISYPDINPAWLDF